MNFKKPNFNFELLREQELVRSEKKIAWERKLAEVNAISDLLGGVDEKIKKSVAAFLIHGFTASASCEGHITEEGEKKHGLPYPWIEVYAPAPAGWEENEEKKHEWLIENLKQQQKMMGYFEEFYKERETPFDARLTFNNAGIYGGFRIQSFGARMLSLFTPGEQKQKLELYRKEMDDFAEFLKNEYFEE